MQQVGRKDADQCSVAIVKLFSIWCFHPFQLGISDLKIRLNAEENYTKEKRHNKLFCLGPGCLYLFMCNVHVHAEEKMNWVQTCNDAAIYVHFTFHHFAFWLTRTAPLQLTCSRLYSSTFFSPFLSSYRLR